MYTGTQLKRLPKPSSFIMFEQKTDSFIVSAAATSSASIVDCAVNPCSPTLKLIGAFANMTMYEDMDLPLSGLLPQLASENAVSLKPPHL